MSKFKNQQQIENRKTTLNSKKVYTHLVPAGKYKAIGNWMKSKERKIQLKVMEK